MLDFSQYKINQENGKMSAATFNDFFEAVKTELGNIGSDLHRLYTNKVTAKEFNNFQVFVGQDGNTSRCRLSSENWCGNINAITAAMQSLWDWYKTNVGNTSAVQTSGSYMAGVADYSNPGSYSVGDTVSNTDWNDMINNAYLFIKAFSDEIAENTGENMYWHFGDNLPVRLS